MRIITPRDLSLFAVNQRKKLGLTQTMLAKKTGLLQKTISTFENSPETVRLSTALLILSCLDINLELSTQNSNRTKDKDWGQEW